MVRGMLSGSTRWMHPRQWIGLGLVGWVAGWLVDWPVSGHLCAYKLFVVSILVGLNQI